MDRDSAAAMCRSWRDKGIRIAFTNGCFDILHKGHVLYLEAARATADKLVVGINSDSSTRRLKGEGRPINGENGRAAVVAALASVDLVVLFDEDTPAALIEKVSPHVLVKGGDYTPDTIVGAGYVRSMGGEVRVIPFVEGYSTTSIEKKIAQQTTRNSR